MSGGGGGTRVSIPKNFRKVIQELKNTVGPKHSDEFLYTTLKDCDMDPKEAGRRLKMIHDVKEIAGKHSVEDVYTMLKECNLDPNEAAQRLLYIDTFHEVKKKQDRRKSISSDTSVDHKRTQGNNQWWRNLSSGKDYGVTKPQERVSRLVIPVHAEKGNNVVNGNGTLAVSNGSYSHKLAPELSADVVVSSKNTCAVGTIQCEIVKRSSPSQSNSGIKFSADQVIEDSENKRKLKSDVVGKIQISESLNSLSLSTCDSSEAVGPSQHNQPPQLLHEPLKEVMETVSITNTHPIPEEKSELKPSPRKPDATLSPHQTVIFPENLQVPENFKNLFTFGSFDDTTLDGSQTESSQQNDEIVPVPEPCLKENISSSESDLALKREETKVEMMPPLVGFQNPGFQSDYGFSYMPHPMGPQFVHVDSGGSVIPSGLGQGQSQSQSPTPTTQPGQNSMPLSPPVFPYPRQPIANYIPYIHPYFQHLYLPQNAHLLNPALFPHQQPPPPTTGGFKFPLPPLFKQENLTPNPNPNPNQDLTPSQEKDNNLQSQLPQGGVREEGQVWGGHGHVPNLVPNYYFNFPQGHPMAFPPYHSSQPFMHQTGGSDEKPVAPPQHRETS